MSRRDQIQMAPEEIDAFLAQQRTLIVGSHGRDGHPHMVPMWFTVLDGDVVFWSYASSQKIVNLRRDARVSCLVETGESYEQLRGVLMEGYARISADPSYIQQVGEAIAQRYAGGELDEAGRQAVRRTGEKRVAVTFDSTRIVSWDHRKLGAGVY